MSSDSNVFPVIEQLDSVVADVKRFYKNSLQEINEMYLDDEDYMGLMFWHNDLKEYVKETEKAGKIK